MPVVIYGPDPTVHDTSDRKPHVIIIGAGLAGTERVASLTLAILLQKANIPYDIYEKSPETRNVGAALFLGPNLAPMFTQLGIMEEYIEKSKPCSTIRLFNEKREQDFVLDFSLLNIMAGYEGRLIPRKVMYDIILSQVPAERIHRGKRMLWMTQGENGVHCKFSDGSEVEGDILVGADGAYSAVRQSMYDRLKKDNKLSASDAKDLPFSCVSVAGYTGPLDPEKFTMLKEEQGSVINTRSFDKPYSWNIFAAKENKMCWSATLYLDEESSRVHNNFRSTDWGPEGAEEMCKEVRDFPICGGDGTLTLGDLIDQTPKDQMAKVMLEEKLHPAGGQGATMAFHDAVALANWINALPSTQVKDLDFAFKAYRHQRHAAAIKAAFRSKQMCKFYGKANDRGAAIARYIFKNMPFWIWKLSMINPAANRPQVSFLPFVKDSGTVPAENHESFRETLKILKEKEAKRAAAAAAAATAADDSSVAV
ncbi:hypothetical protein FBU30_002657 [Linnemannia zychae]|nr:hypothetical protein FBU30_002657 [Linnemannia zychae]